MLVAATLIEKISFLCHYEIITILLRLRSSPKPNDAATTTKQQSLAGYFFVDNRLKVLY